MATLTIKDIAKICNVGISTVSRAINNDPGINKDTRERILKVIEEYHYVPNNSARNLKMTDSNTIALLIKGIDNQFFQGMFKLYEEELNKLEYSFLIRAVGEDEDDADVAIEMARERRLKGIIFLGGLMDYPEEKLRTLGVPYVLCTVSVNQDAPKRNCPAISINDEAESYRAVDYLCKMGHKKIAIVSGRVSDYSVGKTRLEGYKKALVDNGIEVNEKLICYMKDEIPEYTIENGYAVTKELLENNPECTAIYAISDLIAFGVYRAIYEAGKKIPEDYSVMGFDGLEMSKYYCPSLTTMEQPCGLMVNQSIEMLMNAINGNSDNRQLFVNANLVERDSVKRI